MKFGIRLTAVAIAMVALLVGCRKDDFEEITTLCPEVISTSPARNATNVSTVTVVSATFNTPMDPATFNESTFTLRRGGTPVNGTVSVGGKTAFFTSALEFAPNTTYTATIKNGVKEVHGNALQEDYVWTFSTGPSLQPVVVATTPASNATGVPVNQDVSATFNVVMNENTINTSTFTIYQGSTPITGVVTYSGNTATFNPDVDFTPNNTYTARLSSAMRDVAGNSLHADYVWIFSTGTTLAPAVVATSPANNEVGVVLNKAITATFNMNMDPSTLNSTTFSIRRGAIPVSGTVTYANKTATLTPTVSFDPDETYTVTLTTGVRNVAGTPLANDYVWSFTTGTFSSPTVISTSPSSNAMFVPPSAVLVVTFSEPMDPNTIHGTSFMLSKGAISYPGTISVSGNTATFTPKSSLADGYYTAELTTDIRNPAGVSLNHNYVWSFTTSGNIGAPAVDMGTALRFGVFARTGIHNLDGQTEIHNMDVGIYGNRSQITGFPPAMVYGGSIYAMNDPFPAGVAAMLAQARQDLIHAYEFAADASSPTPTLVSGDIGGGTLSPGIYKTNSSLSIVSDHLTLDAQGDADAVWIFQVASHLTVGDDDGTNIILMGGAKARNVYWQVAGTVTIGENSSFMGNVMALSDISMQGHSRTDGRMYSIDGAVTMHNRNMIQQP